MSRRDYKTGQVDSDIVNQTNPTFHSKMVALSSCSFFFPSMICLNQKPISSYGRMHSSVLPCLKHAAIKCTNSNAGTEIITPRPTSAGFYHAALWDDHDFIPSSYEENPDTIARVQELKMEVKEMISLVANDTIQELDLINHIQRLGVAYHFEDEIQSILQKIYNNGTHFFEQNASDNGVDLYFTSLWFRLLRDAGYYVSSDVFNKFTNEKGELHQNLSSDVKGMLSLYEASYLSINGEEIMDEALAFTTKHLNELLATNHSSPILAQEIQHALKRPIHKCVERVQTRHYISIYEQDLTRNQILLEFAKLDFNVLQKLYRKEMSELSTWWKDLDIQSKICFETRDRVVEGYIIISSAYFEPQFSLGRIQLTKLWMILTVVDDAHDLYGNVDELEPLRDAIQRWDTSNLDALTDTMKVIFLEVINLVDEIKWDMINRGHCVGIPYLIKEIKKYARGQFEESKLLFSSDVPTLEKWFSFSIITIGWTPFFIIAIMHMGELATKELFDWITNMPKFVKYHYYISRLTDDIATRKVEKERGTTVSSVTCYMKEHGVSESKAMESLKNMISSLWKDMNEECLKNKPAPIRVLKTLLNIIRLMEVFYAEEGDGYTNSKGLTYKMITSLLVNPITN